MELKRTTDVHVAVRAYINTLLKNDPQVFAEFTEWMEQRKDMIDAQKNDRGMSDKGELKHCISMPELLGAYVLKQFPEIIETKTKMYKFMRAFPQFTASARPFSTKYGASLNNVK